MRGLTIFRDIQQKRFLIAMKKLKAMDVPDLLKTVKAKTDGFPMTTRQFCGRANTSTMRNKERHIMALTMPEPGNGSMGKTEGLITDSHAGFDSVSRSALAPSRRKSESDGKRVG